MVGLPGSGKTHWAQSHMKRNPKKRYHLISTNSVLDCMRVRSLKYCARPRSIFLDLYIKITYYIFPINTNLFDTKRKNSFAIVEVKSNL